MVLAHPSTPEQRAQWTTMMLAHQGEYGLVTRLSRTSGVSRPTLYAWRRHAQQALIQAFTPPVLPPSTPCSLERQVLTVWSAHSSDRDIQTCFRVLAQRGIGLPTITAILADAEQRALRCLATHMPASVRGVALDEIYANDRRGAYLNVVDVHSGAVWASGGPLPVDSDSWTLLLWESEDHGLLYDRVVMDGGAAARAAIEGLHPSMPIQGDQWHVLHTCAQLQARLDRTWRNLRDRTAVVARQAARVASGRAPKGRNPQTDVAAHRVRVATAERVADGVRYLTQELRRLLDVVVLDHRGVLDAQQRQAELDSLLLLLAESADGAEAPQQDVVRRLYQNVTDALPGLLTFVAHLAHLQTDLLPVLGAARQALLGWVWLRRKVLGWSSAQIVAALPTDWQAAARLLLMAWDDAVRVSTAVERWHSILRMHLSVHRTLTPGRLALLAVWHNHRVFTRGIHKGYNPLQLSGIADAPTDWLVALGYPPASTDEASAPIAPAVALAA
jgi:transposase-like protein